MNLEKQLGKPNEKLWKMETPFEKKMETKNWKKN